MGGQIFLLESGQPVEFTADGGAHRREPVTAGRVLVDSGSLEEIEEVVIRDRRHLSEDGVVVPIMVINKHTGRMETPPEIVTRGFLPSEDGAEIMTCGARNYFAHDRAVHARKKRPIGASSRKKFART